MNRKNKSSFLEAQSKIAYNAFKKGGGKLAYDASARVQRKETVLGDKQVSMASLRPADVPHLENLRASSWNYSVADKRAIYVPAGSVCCRIHTVQVYWSRNLLFSGKMFLQCRFTCLGTCLSGFTACVKSFFCRWLGVKTPNVCGCYF